MMGKFFHVSDPTTESPFEIFNLNFQPLSSTQNWQSQTVFLLGNFMFPAGSGIHHLVSNLSFLGGKTCPQPFPF